MRSLTLSLKYKGARTYLHGSDIFNALERTLSVGDAGYLSKLVFKNFARSQIEVLIEEPADPSNVLGTAFWKSFSGEDIRLWLTKTDVAVTESYPFDENAILTSARIEDERILLPVTNAYSVIENIIALTKQLNYTLSPQVSEKWLFGQLDLQQKLPESWQSLRIDRTIGVANSFSRNRILVDGLHYGEIRFVVGRP